MSFTITLDKSSALIGTRISISTSDSTFATSVHDNIVYMGGIPARIIYLGNPSGTGSYNQIVAIVPEGCGSGVQKVQIFKKNTNIISSAVNLTVTYPSISIPVTNSVSTSMFTKGVLKIQPIYDRDLSYTNFTEATDATGVVQNVLSIILTRRGERLFNTSVGTDVESLLFTLVSNAQLTQAQILYEIKSQVELYEPRAKIDTTKSYVDFDISDSYVVISIAIVVPGGTTKQVGITLSKVSKY